MNQIARLLLLILLFNPKLGTATSEEYQERTEPPSGVSSMDSVYAVEVLFEDRERGIAPYSIRMLVTAEYLRMDDGQDEGDFILYDRRAQQILSVTHQNHTALQIVAKPVKIESPYPLLFEHSRYSDPDAPKITGKLPEHITFRVNGEECYNVISVAGLLNEVTQAIKEYLQTLAVEQAMNLANTPPEMQTPCMLANMIFKPSRHLDYGLPIREWDYRGFARSLVSFRESVPVDGSLFEVPAGYRIVSLSDSG